MLGTTHFRSAAKARMKKWRETQQLGFPTENDFLHAKCNYMEDMLRVYQDGLQEAEQYIQQTKSGDASLRLVQRHQLLITETELRETQDQLRQMHELLKARETGGVDHGGADDDSQVIRQPPHIASGANALPVSGAPMTDASLVAALRAELDELRREKGDLELTVRNVQKRLAAKDEFSRGLDRATDDLQNAMKLASERHRQLVNTLLELQGEKSGAGADTSNSSGRATGGSRGALTQQLPQMPTGLSSIERHCEVLKELRTVWQEQQVEIGVATRCAVDAFRSHEHVLKQKVQESYVHGDAANVRLREVEARFAEQRDGAFKERDRALNVRDKALTTLRTLEAQKSKGQRKNAETQTILRGELIGSGRSRTSSTFDV